ncbi:MAG: Hint domain-containing protein, partial [Deltaproteobacteria bacterium]|nr:Hint domain-containing protein [Deltaproteobacteria bacterium]
MQPDRKKLRELGDGTFVIEERGGCYRARYRRCRSKCLPPNAMIATPSGQVPIRELEVGMVVWTRSQSGQRVRARIVETSQSPIVGVHHVAKVVLADGRSLQASLRHPMLGGREIQQLSIGGAYDGSEIVEIESLRYTHAQTYD